MKDRASSGVVSRRRTRADRRAADRAMHAALLALGGGLGVLYLLIACSLLIRPGWRSNAPVIGAELLTAAVALTVAALARRRMIAVRWSHPAAALVAAAALLEMAVDARGSSPLFEVGHASLILLGAGLVFWSARWHALVLIGAAAVWAWGSWRVEPLSFWLDLCYLIGGAAALSIAGFWARIAALRRQERTRRRDRRLRRRLRRAVTQLQRQVAQRRIAEADLRQSHQRLRELAEHRRLLLSELNHRVKNNLAGLFSLVDLYARSASDVESFAQRLRDKLAAMASIHALIAEGGWAAVELHRLVDSVQQQFVASQTDRSRMSIQGPRATLSPRQAAALAVVLQELFTNASKHGALAGPDGRVDLTWRLSADDDPAPRLDLHWRETGAAEAPSGIEPGVGLQLVEGFARYELAGECRFEYGPEGFLCHLTCKLDPPDEPPGRPD